MWVDIIEVATKTGLWALLFVFLLFYVLKEGKKREDKYQKLLENLSGQLECVKEVKKDIKDIKRAFKIPQRIADDTK